MARLLRAGYDAYGVEPAEGMRAEALRHHPELAGRLADGGLPGLGEPFGGAFDGILCSAVLMHVPRLELFDAAYALRGALNPGGRLLVSVPESRPGLDADGRDGAGRLFEELPAAQLELLFERLGFQPVGRWRDDDGLGRPGHAWITLLFSLRDAGGHRAVDQIEGVLSRDRKVATYKLALFRALGEIAMTQPHLAAWRADGRVGVPLARVAELWLVYFWPIVTHHRFIPQVQGEHEVCLKPIAFREELRELGESWRGRGGLARFILDWRSGALDPAAREGLERTMRVMRGAIVEGPVRYAGGSLEGGRLFYFDRGRREIVVPAGIWRELSLMGHWILDALTLRWAEMTVRISRQAVDTGEILPLLLADPVPEREITDARRIYGARPGLACAWTGQPLGGRFQVDHVIPFSLWHNNDLWNLLPAAPAVNRAKLDRLPSRGLLLRRRDPVVACWEALRAGAERRFDHEARQLAGERWGGAANWQAGLFASLLEAVELTAAGRGLERWEPGGGGLGTGD